MKKLFKFSLLALFLGLVACEDATDIIQESELSEDLAYRTVGDLETGLNGVYGSYAPDAGGNGDGDIILFNDLFTDNIKKGISSNGQGTQEANFILQPNTSFANTIWGARYSTINAANRTLRAWDRIAPGLQGAELAQANRIKAELLTLRALCHFELMQYFVEDYRNPTSPGVIIMDFVPELFDKLPRNTVGEVFEFVKGDLDSASGLMRSNRNASLSDPFYINDAVINAIRARVLLFEGKTENYATVESITEDLVSNFALANPDAYQEMFLSDVSSSENIWTLSRLRNDVGVVALYYANQAGEEGNPFFEMSNQLADLYDDADVRRDVNIILDESEVDPSTPFTNHIYIGKYRGTNRGQAVNNIKIIRSSEMLLIKAEMEARQGKFAEARASILALRTARYRSAGSVPQPVMTDLNQSLKVILEERRKELAFEGHRYLDLKRIGKEIGVGIDRDPADCGSFSAPCTLAPTDYRFTLPIPQSEISSNPSIQQNPNY